MNPPLDLVNSRLSNLSRGGWWVVRWVVGSGGRGGAVGAVRGAAVGKVIKVRRDGGTNHCSR